jgi:hypothetical protein
MMAKKAPSAQKSGQKPGQKPSPKKTAAPVRAGASKKVSAAPPKKVAPAKAQPKAAAKSVAPAAKAAAPAPKSAVAAPKKAAAAPAAKKAAAAPENKAPAAQTAKVAKAPAPGKPVSGAKNMKTPPVKPNSPTKTAKPEVPSTLEEAPELQAAESEAAVATPEEGEPVVEKKAKRVNELKIDRTGNLEGQWRLLHERSKAIKPVNYKMSENYEARTALLHKVLGWGYVLTSQNNRLEVLFKDGIKILIANYKAP